MQQPMRFFMFIMWENSPSFSRLAITSIHPLIFCCAEAGAVEGMNPPTQTLRLNTIAFLLRIQQYLQAAVSGRLLACLGLHHLFPLWRKTSKTELCGSHAGLKVYSLKATNTLVMPRNAFQSSDACFPVSGWASSFAGPSFTSSCFLVELPSVQADMFLTLLMVAVCHFGSNHHLSFLLHGRSDEVLTCNGCRHHYRHYPWALILWQHKQNKRAKHKNERLCIFEKLIIGSIHCEGVQCEEDGRSLDKWWMTPGWQKGKMLPTEEYCRSPVKTWNMVWVFLISIYRLLLSSFFVERSCLAESVLCVPTEITFGLRSLCYKSNYLCLFVFACICSMEICG